MHAPIYSLKEKCVWVAGHRGMVGQALVRRLSTEAYKIVTIDRASLDLRWREPTEKWVTDMRPDVVFFAAATVGGIFANNSNPATFLYDNLTMAANVIEACRKANVERLMFLGSSCIYPKLAPQPIREEALLTGPLEPTNEWYALAKIAGLKLCAAYRRQYNCDFISVQPSNLYGPGDNFHPEHSHVPAALIRRFHEAKIEGSPFVTVWGTGTPRREFLFVDDLADACVFLMQRYSAEEPVNIGTGEDLTISEFAHLVANVTAYKGKIVFDRSKPDGMPRKVLDISKLKALGWQPQTSLREGLERTYKAFLESEESAKTRSFAVNVRA